MGSCGVKFAAANLSMHTRSLHRKLSREGTTFTEMLNNTRRQLAHHMLTQTPMSIFDISQTLGYSDAPAFSRSFRCWFGAGPSRWRQYNGA
jgi:AraC-like DNA-binding protein